MSVLVPPESKVEPIQVFTCMVSMQMYAFFEDPASALTSPSIGESRVAAQDVQYEHTEILLRKFPRTPAGPWRQTV